MNVMKAQSVLLGDWIASGAHINAVGACFPTTRELDTAAMAARATVRRSSRSRA